jgi:hypothetical protein
VSSTSMNVASVTVTAITQGLIDPSGIFSLESNLCFTFVFAFVHFVRQLSAYFVTTVASTFIPGRNTAPSC